MLESFDSRGQVRVSVAEGLERLQRRGVSHFSCGVA